MTEREKNLYNLYFNEIKSLKQIKKILHINDRTITKIFNEYGWEKRPKHATLKTTLLKNRPYTNKEWLSKQYNTLGKTCLQIANENKCGESTINFWMKKFNIKARHNSNKDKVFSEDWREKLSKSHIGVLVGTKNPNWKGGVTPMNQKLRHTVEYFNWRKKVFERDNYTCQQCGKRGVYLQAHHIKHFSEYPEGRYDVENGVTLCTECHHKLHRKVVSTEETILVGA